ncbi:MAG: hypothetical protein ACYDDA_04485, partial [Acidiferrobacteraceae bacterium]
DPSMGEVKSAAGGWRNATAPAFAGHTLISRLLWFDIRANHGYRCTAASACKTKWEGDHIATADVYDPTSLSLQLPTGVTDASVSGVFLTTPTPVPDPRVFG